MNLKKDYKKSEQSTHFQTARAPINEGLSYTFRAFHDKMKKSKLDTNNYIYDLDNTMKINLEMIENILPSILSDKIEEKNKLEEKLKRIKQLYEKRLNFKKLKNENHSKILVQNQILEETKRKKDESLNYFEEKFDELCNGLDKKIIFIKKYQKKFDEVQIYIQRECQYYPRWKKLFDDYEIMPFIVKNENLLIQKKKLLKEIKLIVKEFNIVTKENYYYETKTTKGINEDKATNEYKDLINLYLSKNKIMEQKIKCLKKILNKPNSIYRIKFIKEQYLNNKDQFNEDVKTLINVSILNNSKITENLTVNNISKSSKNLVWDISGIDKTGLI